jgi:hypothetical protein
LTLTPEGEVDALAGASPGDSVSPGDTTSLGDGVVPNNAVSLGDITPEPKRGRVVVFTEFPSLVGPLERALILHNLKVRFITGETTDSDRVEVLTNFGSSDGPDVVIISTVAMVGINLSAAHVMILVDQQFSWWDKRQIIGRVNRGEQPRQVIVYDLVGLRTGDVMLNSIAMTKKDTLDAFLSSADYASSKFIILLDFTKFTSNTFTEMVESLEAGTTGEYNEELDVEVEEDADEGRKKKTRGSTKARQPARPKSSTKSGAGEGEMSKVKATGRSKGKGKASKDKEKGHEVNVATSQLPSTPATAATSATAMGEAAVVQAAPLERTVAPTVVTSPPMMEKEPSEGSAAITSTMLGLLISESHTTLASSHSDKSPVVVVATSLPTPAAPQSPSTREGSTVPFFKTPSPTLSDSNAGRTQAIPAPTTTAGSSTVVADRSPLALRKRSPISGTVDTASTTLDNPLLSSTATVSTTAVSDAIYSVTVFLLWFKWPFIFTPDEIDENMDVDEFTPTLDVGAVLYSPLFEPMGAFEMMDFGMDEDEEIPEIRMQDMAPGIETAGASPLGVDKVVGVADAFRVSSASVSSAGDISTGDIPTGVSSTGVGSSGVSFAGVSSSGVGSSSAISTGVSSTGVSSSGIVTAPGTITPGAISPAAVDASGVIVPSEDTTVLFTQDTLEPSVLVGKRKRLLSPDISGSDVGKRAGSINEDLTLPQAKRPALSNSGASKHIVVETAASSQSAAPSILQSPIGVAAGPSQNSRGTAAVQDITRMIQSRSSQSNSTSKQVDMNIEAAKKPGGSTIQSYFQSKSKAQFTKGPDSTPATQNIPGTSPSDSHRHESSLLSSVPSSSHVGQQPKPGSLSSSPDPSSTPAVSSSTSASQPSRRRAALRFEPIARS